MFSQVQFCLIPNHCHFQGVIIATYKHWVGSSGFMVRVRKARDPNQSNNKGSFWNCSVYTQNRAYMQTTEWKWLPQLVFWHLSLASSTWISFYLKTKHFFSGLAYHPHVYPVKTATENASFQKRSQEWRSLNWRLLFIYVWTDENVGFRIQS